MTMYDECTLRYASTSGFSFCSNQKITRICMEYFVYLRYSILSLCDLVSFSVSLRLISILNICSIYQIICLKISLECRQFILTFREIVNRSFISLSTSHIYTHWRVFILKCTTLYTLKKIYQMKKMKVKYSLFIYVYEYIDVVDCIRACYYYKLYFFFSLSLFYLVCCVYHICIIFVFFKVVSHRYTRLLVKRYIAVWFADFGRTSSSIPFFITTIFV